jgi:hypothetical protein
MKRILTVLTSILIPITGYCWSAPGHQAIAIAAMGMIKGTDTETKVNQILDGEDISDAAIWLDRIRDDFKFTDPAAKQEAADFKKSSPDSPAWHFCNFAVGSTAYDFGSKYMADDDVVHALTNAISVLEGNSTAMTKKQALRTVVHLVGDIHQPLHCITGFYDITNKKKPKLLDDVPDPKTATQDRGGNQLMYTKSENLHHCWDLVLPDDVSKDIPTLAQDITSSSLDPIPATDHHHWPEAWAGASMQAANVAYVGISYKSAAFVPDPRDPNKQDLQITIGLPSGQKKYKAAQDPHAQEQLRLGALHLAQLLSKIQFK